MKITVVTAICGGFEELREDTVKGNAEHIAFMDPVVESDVWDVRPACNLFKDPVRNAKIHKVLIHHYVDSDVTIWLDGNITLKVPPEQLVEELHGGQKSICAFRHPHRRNYWEEGNECIKLGLDIDSVQEQIDRQRTVITQDGLWECNVLIRKDVAYVNDMNEKWWSHICRGSKRDQLSFPMSFQDVTSIVGDVRTHPYFSYRYR